MFEPAVVGILVPSTYVGSYRSIKTMKLFITIGMCASFRIDDICNIYL